MKQKPKDFSLVDISIQGKRYGDLITCYRVGRRIACRCKCKRLVFIAIEELAGGTVTSCGCSRPSHLRITQLKKLTADLRRVINFRIASRENN